MLIIIGFDRYVISIDLYYCGVIDLVKCLLSLLCFGGICYNIIVGDFFNICKVVDFYFGIFCLE